ncbi:MAG: hypothetical protein E7256_01470 [Lachnospiraceae bacterium]|nr:hypothetical protein [Lachnospiraceae bacterium]
MRMRVKKSIFLLGILTVIMISGCGKADDIRQKEDIAAAQEEADEIEEDVEMTQEQMDLLIGISVNADRIREGKIYSWQKEILNQYDYALDYLKEKYPSHTFHLVSCDPKSKLNTFSLFKMTADEDSETYYDLYLYSEETENSISYTAKDNYYQTIIKTPYEQYLMERIGEVCDGCIGVSSSITSVEGEGYDEQMTVEDIKEKRLLVSPISVIYMDGRKSDPAQYEKIAASIEKKMKENLIYGAYTVYVLSELPKEDATTEELRDFIGEQGDGASVYEYTFQQFQS